MSKRLPGEKILGAGAVVSAALASMCCILPLGLGAVGLSGTVLSSFFEPLRPYLLALATVLIALGFYFSFRAQAEGEVCTTNSTTFSRASRPTLVVAALATVLLAVFPSIAGFASSGTDTLSLQVESNLVTLHVQGMTCESCAAGLRSELLDVPGVIDAAVSYEDRLAEIRVRQERAPNSEQLIKAVEKAGYTAEVEKK